mmetsp:Transcript_22447/g.66559  ORF Transcript_22447/g.66559 Transcript_22447/m.66559 type:complete len:167 (+) Transcript_22447:817-1317(+)
MTSVSSSCFESFPESSHSKASNRTSDRERCTTCRGRPHKQPPSRLDFRRDVLYGRQAEVRAVLKAYRRALGGGGANGEGMTESKIEPEDEVVPTSSVILISGYSGTGKTSLSKCLRRPVEQSGGKFIIKNLSSGNLISSWSKAVESPTRLLHPHLPVCVKIFSMEQ